jgi:hypothetical protein
MKEPLKNFIILSELIICLSCTINNRNDSVSKLIMYTQPAGVFPDLKNFSLDSAKKNIWQYFEYESDSGVKIIRSISLEKKQFYSIPPNLLNEFKDSLKQYLKISNLKNKYYFEQKIPHPYDGLRSMLYIKTTQNQEVFINYKAQKLLPPKLRKLDIYIEKIIEKTLVEIPQFDVDSIILKNTFRFYKRFPPPPPRDK